MGLGCGKPTKIKTCPENLKSVAMATVEARYPLKPNQL